MQNVLHPRDNLNQQYLSKKEGGRELAIFQGISYPLIQRIEDYIK